MNLSLASTLFTLVLFVYLVTTVTSSQECSHRSNGYAGLITSDGYPRKYQNNIKCTRLIQSLPSFKVQLRFIDLQLEENCNNDYLQIYDGNSSSSRLIGKYCGSNMPDTVETTGENATVVLTTNGKIRRRGFEISWLGMYRYEIEEAKLVRRRAERNAGKCGGILTGKSGTIVTPNYPSSYPPSTNCQWTIKTDIFHEIILKFEDFDLERHKECRYDYVIIKDGGLRQSPVIGEYCGKINLPTIKSSGEALFIEFRSDTTTQRKGFKASWKLESKISETIGDCGKLFNADKGTISSPGYPESKSKRLICKWKIKVPEGGLVRFEFTDLDITQHQGCGEGYVQLRNGKSFGGTLLGTFCGNAIPDVIVSKQNVIVVGLLSDGIAKSRGFKARWTTQYSSGTTKSPNLQKDTPCGKSFRSLSGYIYRTLSNGNCSWNIQVPTGKRIAVTFFELDMADDPDCRREQVEIRDGFNNSPFLTRSCGKLKPKLVTSSQNKIQIRHTVFEKQTSSKLKIYWEIYDPQRANSLFNKATCGITTIQAEKYINGVPQGLGTLPWVVGIMGMFGRVRCGGIILSPEWVLSAAHCFARLPFKSLWTVRAGEWNLMKVEGKEQTIKTKQIFIHPDYNGASNENDISLLHLKQPLTISEYVKPVCLPTVDTKTKNQQKCSIAGWGARKYLRQPKEPLVHVKPRIVSTDKCNRKNIYNFKVTSNMLCAGEKGIDSCQGDGGSGLTCVNEFQKHEVIGLASWGNGCAFPGRNGVYTDVRKYLGWIKSVTGSD